MSEMIKSHLETREGRLQGVLRKLFLLRDGPLENFLGRGGGGAGEVQKKIFAQGKIKRKKIRARQLTLENIHATA